MINTDYKYELGKESEVIHASGNKDTAIKEVNGFFISHFLKLMYNTIDVMRVDDPSFGNSSGEAIFRELLLNEYGKVMSDKFHLTNTMMERYFQNIQGDKSINVTT